MAMSTTFSVFYIKNAKKVTHGLRFYDYRFDNICIKLSEPLIFTLTDIKFIV